jgi:DNA-binding LacI/PurR family transcriptional regulator
MNETKSQPKYLTLKNDLIDIIEVDGLQEHDKFLSVNEIERRFDCSSITIRHALRELQKEGVIYTINKKGSFVAPTHRKSKTFYLIYGPDEIAPDVQEQIQQGIRQFLDSGQNVRVVPMNMRTLEEQSDQLIQLNPDLKGVLFYRKFEGMTNLVPILKSANMPFIYFGSSSSLDPEWASLPHIVYDEEKIMTMAVDHLMAGGHQCIGYLGNQDPISKQRCLHYVEQMLKHQITTPHLHLVKEPQAFKDIRQTLKQIPKDVDALVCVSDRLAVKAIQVLRTMGKNIPEDLSIIAIDGSFLCEYVEPNLSSISLGVEGSIYKSLEFLNQEQHQTAKNLQEQSILKMILRESTRNPSS